ncbi:MAG TPA: hypothetical protein VK467_09180, partial [Gemmatimonadales bacterium]|nr:hypothetical protein [Gemmatimonadales bacterium]
RSGDDQGRREEALHRFTFYPGPAVVKPSLAFLTRLCFALTNPLLGAHLRRVAQDQREVA